MASRRPGVTSRGTARKLAELDNGFAANGESMFTRRAAKPDANATMAGHVKKNPTGRKYSIPHLIRYHSSLLSRMCGEILTETCPVRLAKLEKNFSIKSAFVEKLRSEKS